MAKHLIYLGRVEKGHRIALFDDTDLLARSVPVKDVPVLPENVTYLNCTVKNGEVIPNIKGTKLLRSVVKGEKPNYTLRHGEPYDYKKLLIDPEKEPEYLYGTSEWSDLYRNTRYNNKFYSGYILPSKTALTFWDGTCTENTHYLIANVAVRKSSRRYQTTASTLGITHTGEMFYTCTNDMRILMKAGITFIQVAAPDLSYPDVYSGTILYTGRIPVVGLSDEDSYKVIWHGRNKYEPEVADKAELIWWNAASRTTVCDLRKFKRARVFGVNSVSDASLIIFPESTEEIWLGFLQRCPSLKSVYIPASLGLLREFQVPTRRVKELKFYSDSPLVADFCKRCGAVHIPCANAEDMLSDFYEASDSDYISVADANGIATLAGAQSENIGETGTIWSAALFSLASTGIATETLQEYYPVVDTCKGKYEVPRQNIIQQGVSDGNCEGHGTYGPERTRTMAAALTQFYPLCTKEQEVKENVLEYNKYQLGAYTLYIGVNAFNSVLFKSARPKPEPKGLQPYRSLTYKSPKELKSQYGDLYALNSVALLVDSSNQVIHRFACSHMFTKALRCLEGSAFTDIVPNGVLRYADKLPIIYKYHGQNKELEQIYESLFRSFMIFSYGVKTARGKLVGIDLHTGALVTADFTRDTYDDKYDYRGQNPTPAINFVGVNRLSNITLHPLDADLGHLFDKDCVYNNSK